MNTPEYESMRFQVVPEAPAAHAPEAVGGVPVEEADLPTSELSEIYVPDDQQEPV